MPVRFMSKNKDHVMQVELNDEMDFVCPFYSSRDLQSSDVTDMEYYVVYQVCESCLVCTLMWCHAMGEGCFWTWRMLGDC